jgi:hypothetical protein
MDGNVYEVVEITMRGKKVKKWSKSKRFKMIASLKALFNTCTGDPNDHQDCNNKVWEGYEQQTPESNSSKASRAMRAGERKKMGRDEQKQNIHQLRLLNEEKRRKKRKKRERDREKQREDRLLRKSERKDMARERKDRRQQKYTYNPAERTMTKII